MVEGDVVTAKILQGLKMTGNVLLFLLYAINSYVTLIYRKIVPPQEKSLDGEIFLITGSSTGIGREVTLQLAKYYPKTTLVLWDWNATANKKTTKDAQALGAKVYAYEVDVTNRDQVYETAKKVQEEVGEVTILYNNAGIAKNGDFFAIPDEDLEKVIQVNLISHFWTLKAFLPSMIKSNKGHIVTTASLGAFFGLRHSVPYFAAKFAIRGYLESLQDELIYAHPSKPDEIKFTTIYPTFVNTPMTADKIDVCEGGDKFMKVEYAARKIIQGIRQNQEKVILPSSAEIIVLAKGLMPTQLFTKLVRGLNKGSYQKVQYKHDKQ